MVFAVLAQNTNDPQQSLLEAYGLIVMIAAIGLASIVLVLSIIIARRMARRRMVLLDRETEKRRAERGPPPEDAWKKSAERYVDSDRLTPEEIAQRAAEDQGHRDTDDAGGQHPGGEAEGGTGSAWDDAIAGEQDSDPGEDDPYGLFEDKPYVDPDEDDEDDPGDGIDPNEPWR